MKLILMIMFWGMLGYILSHFFGFWGWFGVVFFLVFYNLATYDKQVEKLKEKDRLL